MGERSSGVISGRGLVLSPQRPTWKSLESAPLFFRLRLPASAACAEPWPPIGARAGVAAFSHAKGLSAPARCAVFSRVLSRPTGVSLQQPSECRVRSCSGVSHGECLVAGRPTGPVRPAAHGEPMCALGLAGQGSTQCPATSRCSTEARPIRPFLHHGFSARTCAAGVWSRGREPGYILRSPPALARPRWMSPMLEKE